MYRNSIIEEVYGEIRQANGGTIEGEVRAFINSDISRMKGKYRNTTCRKGEGVRRRRGERELLFVWTLHTR